MQGPTKESKPVETSEQLQERRLRFEKMLFDLSVRFMAVPSDRLDSEINQALKRLLEFFQTDRCALLEFQPGKGLARITHAAFGKGIEPISGEINLAELFPWCYEQLCQDRPINIRWAEDYPENALIDRHSHTALGIKSALNIPVAVGGRVSRTIVINHTRAHQTWPEDYILRLRLLGEIFVNSLERREGRRRLEEKLRFEKLLSEISSRFINIPAAELDREIEETQRRICELLDIDRSTLWQVREEAPGMLLLTHIHQPSEIRSPPERMNARDFFPWTSQRVLGGETVIIAKMEDLPQEAGRDLDNFALFGAKSTAFFPLSVGKGPVFGVLGFAVVRGERSWPESDLMGFRLIAQVLANALARRQADMALRESEARLKMATAAAGAGLWILDSNTGHVWVTPKTRELFRFTPDQELNYESFFQVIHPDDRKTVHQAVQQALRTGETLHCDFRVTAPGGEKRWISARGQRQIQSAGKPERLLGVSFDITERIHLEDRLKEQLESIKVLQERLESENVLLKEEIKLLEHHKEIIGQSLAIKQVLSQAEQVAGTDSTVLLLGETGTGKKLLARAIHRLSLRQGRPLVTVNCAALPPTLIESELFGREKGAYTGALTRMIGRFEVADGATLFLDEIGELPLDLQSKLLRVLEEGNFERLGSTQTLHVNVRIIAATNRDLARAVKVGQFRQDLFYRLSVFPLEIPPLRERPEDIPLLIRVFVKEFKQRMGKDIESIPKRTLQALQAYSWPGNVRELRNVIEHAMILSRGNTLEVHLPERTFPETDRTGKLDDLERGHILTVLEKTAWRVAGPGGAAEILGLKRTTLQAKMKKLGIRRSQATLPK